MKDILIIRKNGDKHIVLLDDADHYEQSKFLWHISSTRNTYYVRRETHIYNKRDVIYLHREIMSVPSDMKVDHINGNGLDNRRENLRVCTHQQNLFNGRKHQNCSSRFKGVSWSQSRSRWCAFIKRNGKTVNLGRFRVEVEAAIAYNRAATELFGEFANLNVVTTGL